MNREDEDALINEHLALKSLKSTDLNNMLNDEVNIS